MKTKIALTALSFILVIYCGCATRNDSGLETRVVFTPAEKEDSAVQDSSPAAEEASEAEDADEADEPAAEPPVLEAEQAPEEEPVPETEPEPALLTPAAEETMPEAEAEAEAEAGARAGEAWISVTGGLEKLVTDKLTFPLTLRPVYKTPVPVVVRSWDGTEGWRIVLSYSIPGSGAEADVELEKSGADFTGRIYTGIFPGTVISYSYKVYLPDYQEPVEVGGGTTQVLNNGPSSYSLRELELSFLYEPLFDVEKRGDSPGFRRSVGGWQARSLTVPEGIKRWSFDVLYRIKGAEEWIPSLEGVNRRTGRYYVYDTEKNPGDRTRQYDLKLSGPGSGTEVEYCFLLIILDTSEQFLLYAERPPSLRL